MAKVLYFTGVLVLILSTQLHLYSCSDYSLIEGKDCRSNDISSHTGTITECKERCDDNLTCVGVVYIAGDTMPCYLKRKCSTPLTTKSNKQIYLKTQIDGWSYTKDFDCPGNDIRSQSIGSPTECVELCIAEYLCVAALYLPDYQMCYLKNLCANLKQLSDGYIYRMIDRSLATYTRQVGKGCPPYNDIFPSGVLVTDAWQCAAYCTRFKCPGFHMDQKRSDVNCWVKIVCDESNLYNFPDNMVAFVRIDTGNRLNFTTVNSLVCLGIDIEPPYKHLTSGNECKLRCHVNPACTNAAYDHVSKTCYIKGQCHKYAENSYYISFFKKSVSTSDCTWSGNGTDYVGMKSTTISGKTCQHWDQQHPHRHSVTKDMLTGINTSLSEVHNYCRNPNGALNEPWCFTTDPSVPYEYCNVSSCTLYAVGYEYFPGYSCERNGTSLSSDSSVLDSTKCKAFCDNKPQCVSFVIDNNGCVIKSQCNPVISTLHQPTLYIRLDIPGWSLSYDMNCYGLDIKKVTSENAFDCVSRCIAEVNCTTAVFLRESRLCFVKTACDYLVEHYGINVYRILDKEVEGYIVETGKQHAGDDIQGYIVSQVSQCAAYCRRLNCAGFSVSLDVTTGDNCWVKNNVIPFTETGNSQKAVYIRTEFASGYIKIQNKWCDGYLVNTEFSGIPSGEECAMMCVKKSESCTHAVYDVHMHVCYLRRDCQSCHRSEHHEVYFNPANVGTWTSWTELSSCTSPTLTRTRRRSCEGSHFCAGDSEEVQHCLGDVSHLYVINLDGVRLKDHVTNTIKTASVLECLVKCKNVQSCSFVNYRFLSGYQGGQCELNKAIGKVTTSYFDYIEKHPGFQLFVL